MHTNLSTEQNSIWKILFQWKKSILLFLVIIFSVSFLMSKIHPKRVSYAKDYNFLYSMINASNNGREINFSVFEDKVALLSSVRPETDPVFIKKFQDEKDFVKLVSALNAVQQRVVIKDDFIQKFTQASINIENENFVEAYKNSIAFKNHQASLQKYPLFYALNLYRIAFLEEIQEQYSKSKKTKQELKDLLQTFEKEMLSENLILKKFCNEI